MWGRVGGTTYSVNLLIELFWLFAIEAAVGTSYRAIRDCEVPALGSGALEWLISINEDKDALRESFRVAVGLGGFRPE